MRRYLIGFVFAVMSVIIVSNTGFTEEKRKTLAYSGIVQNIDVNAKTITVAKEKLDLAMLFDAAHTEYKNVKGLEDLKAGDKVVVDYDAIKGKTIAVTLTKK